MSDYSNYKPLYIDFAESMEEHNEKIITDFLQFVANNAKNEEFKNDDGWSMADLIELSIRFIENLKRKNEIENQLNSLLEEFPYKM